MTSPHQLYQYYEQEVLPALFERLDEAFPEYHWVRTSHGWTGERKSHNGYSDAGGPCRVTCYHPWGFVDQHGSPTSWLSYVSRGKRHQQHDGVHAVQQLARLAGVDDGVYDVSPSDCRHFERQERRKELCEAYLGYCHAALCGPAGRTVREILHEHYGIRCHHPGDVPLGIYTSREDVVHHLAGKGFSRDEINDSNLVGDPRLPGRLIVPWRDRYGAVSTIVARDAVNHARGAKTRDLYLRETVSTSAFGLDVALRAESGGREHLVIVDHGLDVLYFHQLGACNVVSASVFGGTITADLCEKLAAAGVGTVTLAISSRGDAAKTLAAVEQLHEARHAPQIYVLPPAEFHAEVTAAGYVRHHGLEQFRELLKQRQHAYRYAASHIVRKHRHDHQSRWSEAGLAGVLTEAVTFDAEVRGQLRTQDLERYFWPTILEATGASWDDLRGLYSDRFEVNAVKTENGSPKWHGHNMDQLLHELREALHAGNHQHFKTLIWEAARDYQIAGDPIQDEYIEQDTAETFIPPYTWYDDHEPPVVGSDRFSGHQPLSAPSPLSVASHDPDDTPAAQSRRPSNAEIRALAYQLWEGQGRPDGLDKYFWYEAEKTLKTNGSKEKSAGLV